MVRVDLTYINTCFHWVSAGPLMPWPLAALVGRAPTGQVAFEAMSRCCASCWCMPSSLLALGWSSGYYLEVEQNSTYIRVCVEFRWCLPIDAFAAMAGDQPRELARSDPKPLACTVEIVFFHLQAGVVHIRAKKCCQLVDQWHMGSMAHLNSVFILMCPSRSNSLQSDNSMAQWVWGIFWSEPLVPGAWSVFILLLFFFLLIFDWA